MLRVLQRGRVLGPGTSAYEDLKAIGPLHIGRLGCYNVNPSDGNRLGVVEPSGAGAQCIGVIYRNELDVANPRLVQTAAPTDAVPPGTWSLIEAEHVADQEGVGLMIGPALLETDQVSTASGEPGPGDLLTFQAASADNYGKLIKLSQGSGQRCGICIGYANGVLRYQLTLTGGIA